MSSSLAELMALSGCGKLLKVKSCKYSLVILDLSPVVTSLPMVKRSYLVLRIILFSFGIQRTELQSFISKQINFIVDLSLVLMYTRTLIILLLWQDRKMELLVLFIFIRPKPFWTSKDMVLVWRLLAFPARKFLFVCVLLLSPLLSIL